MTKATILVTGGLGYIGSHTVVALQQANYEVIVMDNLYNSSIEVLERIKRITGKRPRFVKSDLMSAKKLETFFKANPQIEGVIHFAAYKSVPESVANPLAYYQNNVGSLLNLLQSLQKASCSNFVFSSSCSVYGQPEALPVTESNTHLAPTSPYGSTKKVCEEILQDVAQKDVLNAISLRYFNPVGAHESGKLGEDSKESPGNLVPILMQKALGIRQELSVFGNDYPTPDGTCIRDYIHIEDLAQAHVSAIEYLLAGKAQRPHEIYNLGTGKGYTVLEVIHAFERVSGVKVYSQIVSRRAGDIAMIYADASLAQNTLGWKATRSLEEMLLSAWHWEQYKQNILSKRK